MKAVIENRKEEEKGESESSNATRQGVFDIMDELDLIGKALSIKFPNCTVL